MYYHNNMKNYTYRIIIEPDGKYFHGYVPALIGCHTYGRTLTETKKNLNQAISLYKVLFLLK
ncbi:MAG: type II toxin-antitoxin system HicB family antitoxin [Candidatus Paceibacterota bacterium]